MQSDWALQTFIYPLARWVLPLATLGMVRAAPWSERYVTPWAFRRYSRFRFELGPELAGLVTLGVAAYESFALYGALALIQTFPTP